MKIKTYIIVLDTISVLVLPNLSSYFKFFFMEPWKKTFPFKQEIIYSQSIIKHIVMNKITMYFTMYYENIWFHKYFLKMWCSKNIFLCWRLHFCCVEELFCLTNFSWICIMRYKSLLGRWLLKAMTCVSKHFGSADNLFSVWYVDKHKLWSLL